MRFKARRLFQIRSSALATGTRSSFAGFSRRGWTPFGEFCAFWYQIALTAWRAGLEIIRDHPFGSGGTKRLKYTRTIIFPRRMGLQQLPKTTI